MYTNVFSYVSFRSPHHHPPSDGRGMVGTKVELEVSPEVERLSQKVGGKHLESKESVGKYCGPTLFRIMRVGYVEKRLGRGATSQASGLRVRCGLTRALLACSPSPRISFQVLPRSP